MAFDDQKGLAIAIEEAKKGKCSHTYSHTYKHKTEN
jgi:hypothetical protein